MQGLANTGRAELIPLLVGTAPASEVVPLLLQAPFAKITWDLVETLGAASQQAYWKDVNPQLSRGEELDQLQYAVEHLIGLGRPKAAFNYLQYNLKVVPPKLLFRLITAIATSSAEPAGTYQLDSYHLSEAFKLLTDSGEISVDQMAGMEFHYIEAFSQEECRIPNLEKHIETNPVLFVQAVAMAYKRSDGGEDPEEFCAPNQQVLEYRALAAHRLLDKLSSIPGHDSHGELDPDQIEEWVQKVRGSAEELSRRDVCDSCLGKLFSNAPVGSDGVWPCEPVRKVIERIATDRFASGLTTGLYNARGVVWRGEGGDDERELAEKYEKWAIALEFTYPRLSAILRQMVKTYQQHAKWNDTDAVVRRRLLQ
jgi:hypothetical protein